jgi:pilus assembly protein Flp/PilA
MKNYREALRNLLRDDSGQDLIEYALVAGLIGLGAVTALGTLSKDIGSAFTSVGTELTNAT